MSYKIIYDDLWELSGTTSQSNTQLRETIDTLFQNFQSFVGDGSLQGEAMHNMKTYLQEVHGTLLQSIIMLLAEYDTQLLLYKDGYFNIDSNLHAKLPETSFETIYKELNQAHVQFMSNDSTLAAVGRSINDLLSFSVTRGHQISGHFSDNLMHVKNLKTKVGEYEKQHEKDLDSFTEHLTSLRRLVKYYRGQSKNVPRTYQSHDIAKADGAKEFILSYQNVQTHLTFSSQELDAVIKREEGRIESLKQEAIEARKKQASSEFFTGLLIAAGGFIAIVATAGAATPIVATIGFTAGAGTMLYGASQMDEAENSYDLALKGDITTKAFNPLRDTLFFGNQKAYDFVGNGFILASTVTSVAVAPAANLMAKGNGLFRATGMVVAQTAGIGGVSYLGGQLTRLGTYHLSKDVFELTESQSESNAKIAEIFGTIATGLLVAKPIQNAVNNKFGLNAKVMIETDNIVSKYDDIYSYEFNSTTNPGPLSEMNSMPNRNFYGGRYNIQVLDDDIVLYRAGSGDNPMGQWFTTEPPVSRAQVRIDSAVKDIWTTPNGVFTGQSPIDKVYEIKIPKGTVIYSGPVGSQGGIYQGGLNKMQIFIDSPWNIKNLEVLNSWVIKP